MTQERGQISPEQYDVLMSPIKGTRIATRKQSGKSLSYLEAWDVKAHLTRLFGFGNWDLETLDQYHVGTREYLSKDDKPMVEVIWFAKVRLVVRDENGGEIARYAESAVGSTSGPDYLLGEHHDNAVKTAASDALKRCAINLGTQFGLSLYDNGNRNDVVRMTVVKPRGHEPKDPATDEQVKQLQDSLGAQVIGTESSNEGHVSDEEVSA
jgi:recombination DNA repair RAD52 pathway protein